MNSDQVAEQNQMQVLELKVGLVVGVDYNQQVVLLDNKVLAYLVVNSVGLGMDPTPFWDMRVPLKVIHKTAHNWVGQMVDN